MIGLWSSNCENEVTSFGLLRREIYDFIFRDVILVNDGVFVGSPDEKRRISISRKTYFSIENCHFNFFDSGTYNYTPGILKSWTRLVMWMPVIVRVTMSMGCNRSKKLHVIKLWNLLNPVLLYVIMSCYCNTPYANSISHFCGLQKCCSKDKYFCVQCTQMMMTSLIR